MSDTTVQDTLDTRWVPIDDIRPNPGNVRHDLGDLTELTESIRSVGILEPCIVHLTEDEDTWTLIAGHRRHAAALAAGLEVVPCVIREQPDEVTLAEMMLAENTHRAGLDPIDEAQALLRIKSSGKYRRLDQIAERVHRSKEWVAGRLKLLDLPEDCWDQVRTGTVPVGDALEVARLDVPADEKADVLAAGGDAITRAVQESRRRARRAKLEEEYGELHPGVGEKKQELRSHPFGFVRLGDGAHELNVSVALHRSSCDGHVAFLEWSDEPAAYCTRPIEHLLAGDFGADAVEGLDLPAGDLVTITELGFTDWSQRSAHREWCGNHQVLDLPWGEVEICTDPARHTDPNHDAYASVADLLAQFRKDPSRPRNEPPRWEPPEDAVALIRSRLVEQLERLDPPVRDVLAVDACHPARVVDDMLLDAALRWLRSLALNPSGWEHDPNPEPEDGWPSDTPSPAAVEWLLQACVDVGAAPPNLDAIRTRIDVVTRGEHDQEDSPDA